MKKKKSFLHIALLIKDSLQQQIQFNGNIFGNKCCRCNEGSLLITDKAYKGAKMRTQQEQRVETLPQVTQHVYA